MEDAEMDGVEDAINLDDDEFIVMDADEFIEKAEKECSYCYLLIR